MWGKKEGRTEVRCEGVRGGRWVWGEKEGRTEVSCEGVRGGRWGVGEEGREDGGEL